MSKLAILLLFLVLIFACLDNETENDPGYIPKYPTPQPTIAIINDINLANAIRAELKKEKGSPIYENELAGLTELSYHPMEEDKKIKDLSGLSYCKNLQVLKLVNNSFISIESLQALKKLKHLNLSSNKNLEDIALLKQLTSLTTLNLSGDNITDLSGLKDLKELTILHLGNNQIKDITSLGNLAQLQDLSLNNNAIAEILSIKDLKNLKNLNVEENNMSFYYDRGPGSNNLLTISTLGLIKGITLKYRKGNRFPVIHFPDSNFDTYIRGVINKTTGSIYNYELLGITTIDVHKKNIKDLRGMEYCVNLTALDCTGDELSTLDISQNSALTNLICYNNQLTNLDISKNITLIKLWCYTNKLTSLDTSKNIALTELFCRDNSLSSLDLSSNRVLKTLYCSQNQLSSLNLSENITLIKLWCYKNKLTSLDISKNSALDTLWCYENQLTSLDISNNKALKELWCFTNELSIDTINKLLITLYQNAKENNIEKGKADLSGQTLKAPPSGAGLDAKNKLINELSWDVTTD